jgi:hypothetical protein
MFAKTECYGLAVEIIRRDGAILKTEFRRLASWHYKLPSGAPINLAAGFPR